MAKLVTVIDTETTGFDAEDGGVCEIAGVLVDLDARLIAEYHTALTDPGCPIGLGAMATHHITEAMVRDKIPLINMMNRNLHVYDANNIFCAHNAAFDMPFLPEPWKHPEEVNWICTWRAAMHIWPDAPSHSNQVLRYWLGLDVSDMPAEAGTTPHRALYDTWCTAKLLLRMLEERSLVELIKMRTTPVELRTCHMKKHRGKQWDDVPLDYIRWVLRKTNPQGDLKFTLEKQLEKRS